MSTSTSISQFQVLPGSELRGDLMSGVRVRHHYPRLEGAAVADARSPHPGGPPLRERPIHYGFGGGYTMKQLQPPMPSTYTDVQR
jgi:hypothetical protein